MSDARAKIMGAVAKATTRRDASIIDAEAARLVADPQALRPDFSGQSLLDRFVEKATSERVTATVEMLKSEQDVPRAVATYLEQTGLPASIALQPRAALTSLNWFDIATHANPTQDEPVALTFADMGVAETGSVVFLTAPDAPVLMNFLPLHHLVVLRADQLLGHLEDVFDRIGHVPTDQPRSINIVTGTSGTADIEAKNVRGAHGPRFMHILVIAAHVALPLNPVQRALSDVCCP